MATYTVVSGDCLSTIALRFYGDEGAWNEIWAANANRMMADGMRFGDPNLIYPGWVLVLPGLPGASPTEPTPTDPSTVLVDGSAGVQACSGAQRRLATSGRSKGWEWTGGVGARADQGHVRPDDEPSFGTAPNAGRPVSARRARLGHLMAQAAPLRHQCASAVTPSPGRWCTGYPSPPALEFQPWSGPPICVASGADAHRLGPPEATTKLSPTRTRPP